MGFQSWHVQHACFVARTVLVSGMNSVIQFSMPCVRQNQGTAHRKHWSYSPGCWLVAASPMKGWQDGFFFLPHFYFHILHLTVSTHFLKPLFTFFPIACALVMPTHSQCLPCLCESSRQKPLCSRFITTLKSPLPPCLIAACLDLSWKSHDLH